MHVWAAWSLVHRLCSKTSSQGVDSWAVEQSSSRSNMSCFSCFVSRLFYYQTTKPPQSSAQQDKKSDVDRPRPDYKSPSVSNYVLSVNRWDTIWSKYKVGTPQARNSGYTLESTLRHASTEYPQHMSQRTTKRTIGVVPPAKTQISLHIRAGWSESSLIACAFYTHSGFSKRDKWELLLYWVDVQADRCLLVTHVSL